MRNVCKQTAQGPAKAEVLSAVTVSVARAQRRLPQASCLSRAVAGWIMLRRRGVRASVRVGARRDAAGVLAHAWLQCGSQEVFGSDCAQFVVFPEIS